MNIYLVGGAVRDQLLGLPIRDRDFVVVGANPRYMLQQGFKAVGKDFPVFLHPETQEEYALARTERKVAQGYAGFSFYAEEGVTLIQDLARRDLTINAMAQDENGRLIDPFHGEADLCAGILRHVSTAFVEDPVRILRLARFAARYPSFSIAPETLILMREMVQSGEVDALVPERVWQELAKGLLEIKPSRMLQTLRDCGALARLLPELNALFGVPQPAQHHPEIDCGLHSLLCLDSAAQAGFSLSVRFAALVHDLGKGLTPFELLPRHHGHEASGKPLVSAVCDRLRVPAASREIALLTSEYHGDIHRAWTLRAQTICARLQRFDVVRRPARLLEILQACMSDARGRTGFESCTYLPMLFWQKMAAAYTQIDAGQLAQNAPHPSRIAEIIYAARLVALKQARKMWCIEHGYPE